MAGFGGRRDEQRFKLDARQREELATRCGARAVMNLALQVASHLTGDATQLYFNIIGQASAAEAAALDIMGCVGVCASDLSLLKCAVRLSINSPSGSVLARVMMRVAKKACKRICRQSVVAYDVRRRMDPTDPFERKASCVAHMTRRHAIDATQIIDAAVGGNWWFRKYDRFMFRRCRAGDFGYWFDRMHSQRWRDHTAYCDAMRNALHARQIAYIMAMQFAVANGDVAAVASIHVALDLNVKSLAAADAETLAVIRGHIFEPGETFAIGGYTLDELLRAYNAHH